MSASNVGSREKSQPQLVITRAFDAPRELVYRLWTDPKHLARWWGPHGFTTTILQMDVRPGGTWRYRMRGPDGNDYPFDGLYLEIDEPRRLVFSGTIHGDRSQQVWTEVTFTEQEGKTTLTVRQIYSFESPATRGAPIGWSQTLDRLSDYLAQW
jgi:uncharacterized protein YndB with AHSA1/START domain